MRSKKNPTSETRTGSVAGRGNSAQTSKISKTMSKKSKSKNGLSVKESLEQLNASISIAKGLHAILYSKLLSASISKSVLKMEVGHLRILSEDLLNEIWKSESIVTDLLTDPRPRLTV